MVAVLAPDEEECYLLAIMDGPDGIDLAEFLWTDEESEYGCFRAWDVQWAWYTNEDVLQVDQCGRSLGKSNGIQMRAFAFPFNFPGSEMLITAPELNHLRPLTDGVEARLMSTRMSREMLPLTKGKGIARQPHWQARFSNGSRIVSRLPNKDGKGVKGSCSADSLVLTKRGHVRADEVEVGDEVLTHCNRWRPVVDAWYSDAECVEIDGGGFRGLMTSWNHRMIGRRSRNPQRATALEGPRAVIVDDEELTERWYFGSPALFPAAKAEVPDWARDEEALLALAGWYVAEGNQGTRRVAFTVRKSETDAIQQLASRLGLGSGARHKHGGAWTVEVYGAGLAAWLLNQFGQHASEKRLPVWLLGCDPLLQRAFMDAYLAGDGHHDRRTGKADRWMASTSSRELATGLRLLGQALGYACSMSYVDPKPNELCAAPRRAWRVTLRESARNVHRDGAWDWQKVRRVTELVGERRVVTLQVADDESYVADGLLHHNMHPLVLEADEMQDYPLAGWVELIETLKRGSKGAQWRCHGVARGVRDKFYEITQDDSDWTVHRIMAPHRPSWDAVEREEKIKQYGGSRQNPDYRRNIYGDHGDATNPLFVLARLMQCVDQDQGSEYNNDVYQRIAIEYERVQSDEHPDKPPIEFFLDLPGTHRGGWTQAPKGYTHYYAGMDVGLTNHPSEILVFGRRASKDEHYDLLTRVHLKRIHTDDQKAVIRWLFGFYGQRLTFAIDAGGLGFPIYQELKREPVIGGRVYGWKFNENVVTGFEDRELERDETLDDIAIRRPFVEHASDALRNDFVDPHKVTLPFDRELLSEFQGQNYTIVKGVGNPYGKRSYSEGMFHALDAAKVAIGGIVIPPLQERLDAKAENEAVLDVFLGAMV